MCEWLLGIWCCPRKRIIIRRLISWNVNLSFCYVIKYVIHAFIIQTYCTVHHRKSLPLSADCRVCSRNICICNQYSVSFVANQNYIQDGIKCRLKAGMLCYYSLQTLLSSRLLSKNLKIKIYKIIILPVLLYGCETWSLTLREECRLRAFKNRILRQIFGPKSYANGEWKRLHNEVLRSLYCSP